MTVNKSVQIDSVLTELHHDARFDHIKMLKGASRSVFRPMKPQDFKDAYLSISKKQGEALTELIRAKNLRTVVEFGTSFGISTLYLAKGVSSTGGRIVTTELIASKASKAKENFRNAGVEDLIEVRVGNALETLRDFNEPIDLLFLDGWKELYLPLFRILEGNFRSGTVVYVDNADMADTKAFLRTIAESKKYHLQPEFNGKVVIITILA
ncbi:hypothetical protein FUA23_08980 [Neolewinella aurantiaca]|uniref:O-methyltransferase n=1 Tax=Neolewinella aurantiaca TaxID=2602767 RepID=A0A5C7FW28_9BACT|nr:class I SAM-dependent methyltransferase [Neolewinella aurantiaca]TXF89809.1 hypothetical protein FUA23_08980 [Neolewinella aurantiaca]